ncbi:unnamed protein product [Didymodactylos carnosus]|uniref:Uncharacterized protein n=1 Tax=Didymodactylos carnosus TaxID=1234261 RepID=A0A814PQL5_9BILA|nr:unnamed protein product [Didymodactylos carnosus]CAF1162496.1 unnamed protein product [Didymodactylos carnosus]CAF3873777.1 unnamed protein product [Didymodactylos carnosus]CAF3974132.1 unnamed protein product [Didymodactylos carnosus]
MIVLRVNILNYSCLKTTPLVLLNRMKSNNTEQIITPLNGNDNNKFGLNNIHLESLQLPEELSLHASKLLPYLVEYISKINFGYMKHITGLVDKYSNEKATLIEKYSNERTTLIEKYTKQIDSYIFEIKSLNASRLMLKNQYNLRGALEFIRSCIQSRNAKQLNFQEPVDKTLTLLTKDLTFINELTLSVNRKKNSLRLQDVEKCLASLYHRLSQLWSKLKMSKEKIARRIMFGKK